jgi:hypothetical protein
MRRARPSFRRKVLTVTSVVVGLGAVLTLGIAYLYFSLVHTGSAPNGGSGNSVSPTPAKPACATVKFPDADRLGDVAWVDSGALFMVDLGTCQQTVVLGSGATSPVRFSPDGTWLAFGDGQVVPAAGGTVQRPLGSAVTTWEWSPIGDVLAGVTQGGGVVTAGPEQAVEELLPDGANVAHLFFSPNGRRLAIDRVGEGIQVIDLSTAKADTVFHESDPHRVPEVAGWSPDGRWILYRRGPVGEDGGPLDTVPADGGPWFNVFDPVLPYRDFLSGCGSQVALSAGPELAVTEGGKQIVLSGPPDWSFHNLTNDFTRSWFWPACSPDGRWVAITDTFNQTELANDTIPRALWLLAADGSSRRLLVPGTHLALEAPRWSSDGTVIMAIDRSGKRWSSPGRLFLVRINPGSGRLLALAGPIAELGSAPGIGGHQLWSDTSDWYRP